MVEFIVQKLVHEGVRMVNNLRSPEIIKLANQRSILRVEELAKYFNVSVQTIRKDLNKLCSDGQLERVHGGAIIPSQIENIEYEQRKNINFSGKKAIGRECAKEIPNDICLFMGIGTSTETAARLLLGHKNLLIVTNNLNIANILKKNIQSEVVVTGGNLRKSDGALIGQPALETIQNFKFDLAIIGCSALDNEGNMLDFDTQEILVNQSIISQAEKTYLVADHTKFMRRAPIKIASLSTVDCFFTDKNLERPLLKKCASWNTDVRYSR